MELKLKEDGIHSAIKSKWLALIMRSANQVSFESEICFEPATLNMQTTYAQVKFDCGIFLRITLKIMTLSQLLGQ